MNIAVPIDSDDRPRACNDLSQPPLSDLTLHGFFIVASVFSIPILRLRGEAEIGNTEDEDFLRSRRLALGPVGGGRLNLGITSILVLFHYRPELRIPKRKSIRGCGEAELKGPAWLQEGPPSNHDGKGQGPHRSRKLSQPLLLRKLSDHEVSNHMQSPSCAQEEFLGRRASDEVGSR
jgi:hypothetical protein